jgi:hypothetical protein
VALRVALLVSADVASVGHGPAVRRNDLVGELLGGALVAACAVGVAAEVVDDQPGSFPGGQPADGGADAPATARDDRYPFVDDAYAPSSTSTARQLLTIPEPLRTGLAIAPGSSASPRSPARRSASGWRSVTPLRRPGSRC